MCADFSCHIGFMQDEDLLTNYKCTLCGIVILRYRLGACLGFESYLD